MNFYCRCDFLLLILIFTDTVNFCYYWYLDVSGNMYYCFCWEFLLFLLLMLFTSVVTRCWQEIQHVDKRPCPQEMLTRDLNFARHVDRRGGTSCKHVLRGYGYLVNMSCRVSYDINLDILVWVFFFLLFCVDWGILWACLVNRTWPNSDHFTEKWTNS